MSKCHQKELTDVRKEEIEELREKVRELKLNKPAISADLETNEVITDQRKDSELQYFYF